MQQDEGGPWGLSLSHKPGAAYQTLAVAEGGRWAKLAYHQGGRSAKGEWRRGKVRVFSARSRSRLFQAIAKIDRTALACPALFATLTYPGSWPADPRLWKSHLSEWARLLADDYPSAFAIWKLEPQRRGAPHYHLILFGMVGTESQTGLTLARRWLSRTWYDTVGSGDIRHLKAGTNLQPVRSERGLAAYAAKYLAKVDESEATEGWGRYWGVIIRRNYPVTVGEIEISEPTFYRMRRMLRRLIRSPRGYHRSGGSASGVWAMAENTTVSRLLDWAGGGEVVET